MLSKECTQNVLYIKWYTGNILMAVFSNKHYRMGSMADLSEQYSLGKNKNVSSLKQYKT